MNGNAMNRIRSGLVIGKGQHVNFLAKLADPFRDQLGRYLAAASNIRRIGSGANECSHHSVTISSESRNKVLMFRKPSIFGTGLVQQMDAGAGDRKANQVRFPAVCESLG